MCLLVPWAGAPCRVPEATEVRDANLKREKKLEWIEKMKLRMTKTLKFWVGVESDQKRAQVSPKGRKAVIGDAVPASGRKDRLETDAMGAGQIGRR
jgi:hypothetical protein